MIIRSSSYDLETGNSTVSGNPSDELVKGLFLLRSMVLQPKFDPTLLQQMEFNQIVRALSLPLAVSTNGLCINGWFAGKEKQSQNRGTGTGEAGSSRTSVSRPHYTNGHTPSLALRWGTFFTGTALSTPLALFFYKGFRNQDDRCIATRFHHCARSLTNFSPIILSCTDLAISVPFDEFGPEFRRRDGASPRGPGPGSSLVLSGVPNVK